VKNVRRWLTPPILFPALLIVLIVAYALLRGPT
jgi:hypothetical protein